MIYIRYRNCYFYNNCIKLKFIFKILVLKKCSDLFLRFEIPKKAIFEFWWVTQFWIINNLWKFSFKVFNKFSRVSNPRNNENFKLDKGSFFECAPSPEYQFQRNVYFNLTHYMNLTRVRLLCVYLILFLLEINCFKLFLNQ
jgi:hypothetical protein